MQILVNLFHPNLEKSIVNRRWLNELEQHSQRSESRISASAASESAASESAISESAISESAASDGENSQVKITINQVYSEYPDGVINVAREQQLLEAHDRIVFQHPFLWYSVPALMKQWMDDVLTYGWAYGPGGTALHGKDWVSVTQPVGQSNPTKQEDLITFQ
jgi:putative NADPH-quinone reductase